MKVIVTGFDPFGGESINPAYEALKLLPTSIEGASILTYEIPTIFGKSIEVVRGLIEQNSPEIILHIGQAGGRYDITPERVAINYDDARIEDNAGNAPLAPIIEGAPPAYFATLPIKQMVAYARASKVPASISNTAGTFVCNHVMYGSLHFARVYNEARGYLPGAKGYLRSGFVHVPFINEQVLDRPNTPFMSLEMIASGLASMIRACVLEQTDLAQRAGAIC